MANLRRKRLSFFPPNCVPWDRKCTRPMVGWGWYGKGKRGAGIRKRKPESRNSVLRTVYVGRGVEGEGLIKFLTVRNLVLSRFCDSEWMNQQIRRGTVATDGTRNEHGYGRRQRWGSAGASPYRWKAIRVPSVANKLLVIQLRNAEWEGRDRAIADCGRCGRLGEAAGRSRGEARRLRGARQGQVPEPSIECEHLRLCSLMFAYVRLMGEKMLRALRAASAARGHCTEWGTPRSHGEHGGAVCSMAPRISGLNPRT